MVRQRIRPSYRDRPSFGHQLGALLTHGTSGPAMLSQTFSEAVSHLNLLESVAFSTPEAWPILDLVSAFLIW